MIKYIRGSVWWVELPATDSTHVQRGKRPCVIISNNIGNVKGQTVVIVPFTTSADYLTKIHPKLNINGKSNYALTEQIITVNISNLIDFVGILTEVELKLVEDALKIELGLTEVVEPIKEITVHKVPLKEQEKSETVPKKTKSKRRVWTPKLRLELLEDGEKMTTAQIVEKWQFTDGKQARTYIGTFKKWKAQYAEKGDVN